MSYEETGVLTEDEIRKILPPRERLERGPVAIIECVQPIPCNPCVEACKSGAITKKSLAGGVHRDMPRAGDIRRPPKLQGGKVPSYDTLRDAPGTREGRHLRGAG